MKIASWNIAGGHTVASKQHFDYEEENAPYFAEQLHLLRADVICLQETHSNKQRSVAAEIAKQLGDYYLFESAMSPSHIDPAFKLGMAILTKNSFEHETMFEYPDPSFDLYLHGRHVGRHAKGVQQLNYRGVQIANTQLLPILIFGYDYHEGEAKKLAAAIEERLLERLDPPFVLCGDMGMPNGQATAFPKLFEELGICNTLPKTPTYHREHQESVINGPNVPDVIYVAGSSLNVRNAGVITTKTDHYLCWADISIN